MDFNSISIHFCKVSDETHTLTICGTGRADEKVSCETRSMLFHDFLHFVVESEAQILNGFWGKLAKGAMLSELNAISRTESTSMEPEIQAIEAVVGLLHSVTKGRTGLEVMDSLALQSGGTGWTIPVWLNAPLVDRCSERFRKLKGHWLALPYGDELVLKFPDWL